MVDCDFFECIEFDEESGEVYNAVCTMPSPCWPDCGSCMSRKPYMDTIAEVQEAEQLGTYRPHVLMQSIEADLLRSDVDVLDGSINRQVRINNDEDNEVHRLYHIYKSL